MEHRAGDGVEEGESLHPSVKIELDRLNQASDEINRLENELDEARSRFSSTRNESTQQLNALAEKVKSSVIKKARPYYEAKEQARKAQEEALKAARQFQSANGIHRAAKETISLAEQKLCQEESARVLSSEWQEMFNHATIRLMEAEKEKRRSEEEHHRKSRVFSDAEKHMQEEEKRHKRSIARARPYFERKAELQTKLEFLKVAVEALHEAVGHSKRRYSEALGNLERISNEVHEQRKGKLLLRLPREPGVGAESASPGVGSGINLRTSFDDPETPGIGPATIDMSSDSCDVIKEEEDELEESDVSERCSTASDTSCTYSSPAEQSQLGGSVQPKNISETTEPNGADVRPLESGQSVPGPPELSASVEAVGDVNVRPSSNDLGRGEISGEDPPVSQTGPEENSLPGSQKSTIDIPRQRSSIVPCQPTTTMIRHDHSALSATPDSAHRQEPLAIDGTQTTSGKDNVGHGFDGTVKNESEWFATESGSLGTSARPPVLGSCEESREPSEGIS